MRSKVRRSLAAYTVAVLLGWGWLVPSARATLLFDPADPALAGATVVPMDASIGFAVGQLTHTTVQNGVQITFTTTNANGFYDGTSRLVAYWPEGVMISFSPPVGAVGFGYFGAECAGQGLFDGAAADESFQFPFGTRIKEVDLETLVSGTFTAAVTVGPNAVSSTQAWSFRSAGHRLVTP